MDLIMVINTTSLSMAQHFKAAEKQSWGWNASLAMTLADWIVPCLGHI